MTLDSPEIAAPRSQVRAEIKICWHKMGVSCPFPYNCSRYSPRKLIFLVSSCLVTPRRVASHGVPSHLEETLGRAHQKVSAYVSRSLFPASNAALNPGVQFWAVPAEPHVTRSKANMRDLVGGIEILLNTFSVVSGLPAARYGAIPICVLSVQSVARTYVCDREPSSDGSVS